MAMHLYLGIVGNGKTLSAVMEILKRMAIGIHCVTNIHLNKDKCLRYLDAEYGVDLAEDFDRLYHPLTEDQIFNLVENVFPGPDRDHPNLIVIDEAPEWFDSRSYAETSKQQPHLHTFLRQSRKLHLDIIFICQHDTDLDKKIRGQCVSHWHFVDLRQIKLIGIRYPFPHIKQAQFLLGCKVPNFERLITISPYIYDCYSSYQLLRPIPGLPETRTERVKTRRVKMFSKQYFRILRPIHFFLIFLFILPCGFACNRSRVKQLNADLKVVKELKTELITALEVLRTNGVPVRSVESIERSVSVQPGAEVSLYPNELYDGSLIVREIRRWGGPSQFEVVLDDGRILRRGSFFHRGLMVLSADEYRLTCWSVNLQKEVVIPVAIYDRSISSNSVSSKIQES